MKRITRREARRAERAMKSALYHGVDPYNSAIAIGAKYEASWQRDAERQRERDGHWLDLAYNRQDLKLARGDVEDGDYIPDFIRE